MTVRCCSSNKNAVIYPSSSVASLLVEVQINIKSMSVMLQYIYVNPDSLFHCAGKVYADVFYCLDLRK